MTFGLSLLVTFNYYQKKKKKKKIHYPTLPAKTLCSIPSTHLLGFRNYIATILKSYLGGMSIILLGLLCAVQCHVTCCIVMFCCFPLLTVGDILLPVFFIVRICSSTGVVISRLLTVGATLFSMVLNIQATKYSSHHISSFLTGVNCLSHPIFYGANCSSHHVVSFFTGVNGLSHPIVYGATVQATIIFSSVMGVNCFSHPIFYGGNCSSHHVLSFFTRVNCFSHPV